METQVAANKDRQVDQALADGVERITKLVDLPLGGTSVWHLLEKESPQYKAAHASLTKQNSDADAALEQFAKDLRTIASKFSCLMTHRAVNGEKHDPQKNADRESAGSLTCLLKACTMVFEARGNKNSVFSRALNSSIQESQEQLSVHPYAVATMRLGKTVRELATSHGSNKIAEQLLLDGETREAILMIGRYDYSTMPTFRVHSDWTTEQIRQVEQEYEDTVVRQTAQRAQRAQEAYEQTVSSSSITPTSFVSEFEKFRPNEPNQNEIARGLGLPYQ
jgi:dihydrofolate reductase